MPLSFPRKSLPSALLFLLILSLSACGGSSTAPSKPTPTPTPEQGEQLLKKAAQSLNSAKTIHAIFDLAISGQTLSGTNRSAVWSIPPGKNRTVVLQSTLSQFPAGSIVVTDGKQIWQYDPMKKVVYTGPVSTTGNGTPTAGPAGQGNQNQFILNLVKSIFTHSGAVLVSSSATINGHAAYDVHITPLSQAATPSSNNLNYDGDVYLDKTTALPVRVKLAIQGFGQITVDLPILVLNQPVAASLFTFVPPPGVKVLPLQQERSGTGSLTLAQAEQQAGYHLLSIPASQSDYQLQGVDVLGAPGNQIYTLNYLYKGTIQFSIAEGKALANLPTSGQQISLRGITATLSTVGDTTTLTWTEKGVGIQVAGPLSRDQVVAIANLLS